MEWALWPLGASFTAICRLRQPSRKALSAFFRGRQPLDE